MLQDLYPHRTIAQPPRHLSGHNYSSYELNRRYPKAATASRPPKDHHISINNKSSHTLTSQQQQQEDGFYLHDPRTLGYNRLSDLFPNAPPSGGGGGGSSSSSEDSGLCLPPTFSTNNNSNGGKGDNGMGGLLPPVKRPIQRPRRAAPLPPVPTEGKP